MDFCTIVSTFAAQTTVDDLSIFLDATEITVVAESHLVRLEKAVEADDIEMKRYLETVDDHWIYCGFAWCLFVYQKRSKATDTFVYNTSRSHHQYFIAKYVALLRVEDDLILMSPQLRIGYYQPDATKQAPYMLLADTVLKDNKIDAEVFIAANMRIIYRYWTHLPEEPSEPDEGEVDEPRVLYRIVQLVELLHQVCVDRSTYSDDAQLVKQVAQLPLLCEDTSNLTRQYAATAVFYLLLHYERNHPREKMPDGSLLAWARNNRIRVSAIWLENPKLLHSLKLEVDVDTVPKLLFDHVLLPDTTTCMLPLRPWHPLYHAEFKTLGAQVHGNHPALINVWNYKLGLLDGAPVTVEDIQTYTSFLIHDALNMESLVHDILFAIYQQLWRCSDWDLLCVYIHCAATACTKEAGRIKVIVPLRHLIVSIAADLMIQCLPADRRNMSDFINNMQVLFGTGIDIAPHGFLIKDRKLYLNEEILMWNEADRYELVTNLRSLYKRHKTFLERLGSDTDVEPTMFDSKMIEDVTTFLYKSGEAPPRNMFRLAHRSVLDILFTNLPDEWTGSTVQFPKELLDPPPTSLTTDKVGNFYEYLQMYRSYYPTQFTWTNSKDSWNGYLGKLMVVAMKIYNEIILPQPLYHERTWSLPNCNRDIVDKNDTYRFRRAFQEWYVSVLNGRREEFTTEGDLSMLDTLTINTFFEMVLCAEELNILLVKEMVKLKDYVDATVRDNVVARRNKMVPLIYDATTHDDLFLQLCLVCRKTTVPSSIAETSLKWSDVLNHIDAQNSDEAITEFMASRKLIMQKIQEWSKNAEAAIAAAEVPAEEQYVRNHTLRLEMEAWQTTEPSDIVEPLRDLYQKLGETLDTIHGKIGESTTIALNACVELIKFMKNSEVMPEEVKEDIKSLAVTDDDSTTTSEIHKFVKFFANDGAFAKSFKKLEELPNFTFKHDYDGTNYGNYLKDNNDIFSKYVPFMICMEKIDYIRRERKRPADDFKYPFLKEWYTATAPTEEVVSNELALYIAYEKNYLADRSVIEQDDSARELVNFWESARNEYNGYLTDIARATDTWDKLEALHHLTRTEDKNQLVRWFGVKSIDEVLTDVLTNTFKRDVITHIHSDMNILVSIDYYEPFKEDALVVDALAQKFRNSDDLAEILAINTDENSLMYKVAKRAKELRAAAETESVSSATPTATEPATAETPAAGPATPAAGPATAATPAAGPATAATPAAGPAAEPTPTVGPPVGPPVETETVGPPVGPPVETETVEATGVTEPDGYHDLEFGTYKTIGYRTTSKYLPFTYGASTDPVTAIVDKLSPGGSGHAFGKAVPPGGPGRAFGKAVPPRGPVPAPGKAAAPAVLAPPIARAVLVPQIATQKRMPNTYRAMKSWYDQQHQSDLLYQTTQQNANIKKWARTRGNGPSPRRSYKRQRIW